MLGDALKVFNTNGYPEVYDYILELLLDDEEDQMCYVALALFVLVLLLKQPC